MKSLAPCSADLEAPEASVIGEPLSSLTEIMDISASDPGHVAQSVHTKSQGIVSGALTALRDLHPEHAQGLFAAPGTHAFLPRISIAPGDILDDAIFLPCGAGLKALDAEGSEGLSTQDLLLVDGPAAVAPVETSHQEGRSEERARAVDDGTRFSPWTGVEAHCPLGAIDRARLTTYSVSAACRERVNRCPVRGPRAADLPL